MLKNSTLEIELWLPTFFIFCNDYRLKTAYLLVF
jgi:hypothetical protein